MRSSHLANGPDASHRHRCQLSLSQLALLVLPLQLQPPT